MDRNHSIIMYISESTNDSKYIRCFACIGSDYGEGLCENIYLRNINHNYTFQCGVQGYNKDAIRKSNIEYFNNSIHKIIMTTNQCFLCDKKCKYPEIQCRKILETIIKYKEVVGIT